MKNTTSPTQLPQDLIDSILEKQQKISAWRTGTQLPQDFIDSIRPITWRTDPDFSQITGVSRRRIANMDSEGTGPAERVLMGRNRVGYPKKALVEWLESRMRLESRKSIPDEAA